MSQKKNVETKKIQKKIVPSSVLVDFQYKHVLPPFDCHGGQLTIGIGQGYHTDGTCHKKRFCPLFPGTYHLFPLFPPFRPLPVHQDLIFFFENRKPIKLSKINPGNTVFTSGEGHQTGATLSKGLSYNSFRNVSPSVLEKYTTDDTD